MEFVVIYVDLMGIYVDLMVIYMDLIWFIGDSIVNFKRLRWCGVFFCDFVVIWRRFHGLIGGVDEENRWTFHGPSNSGFLLHSYWKLPQK